MNVSSALHTRLQASLTALAQKNRYRQRKVVSGTHAVQVQVDGRLCLNFCANDYLGLAADPRLAAAAHACLADGVGSGAAALVSGYNQQHAALEAQFADYVGTERALLFSSGWAANVGVLRALLGKGDVLIADELNHASLIDGGRASGADYQRIAHADAAAFTTAITQPRAADRLTLVATDSLFSMDGDYAPLAAIATACQQADAALMVDDAHGFGVLGAGRGALHANSTRIAADVYMVGCGKALGTSGALVAGSAALIETLIQKARTWVFSTAPPPMIAAATRTSLQIIASAEGDQRRALLAERVQQFREGAQRLGLPLSASNSAIQPIILGSDARALAVSQNLWQQGFWVAAIRPPTVAEGTARLRITLSAAHTSAQVEALLQALVQALGAIKP